METPAALAILQRKKYVSDMVIRLLGAMSRVVALILSRIDIIGQANWL